MEFKEFIKLEEASSQRVWRSAAGQPHYSRVGQRPSRPILNFPHENNEFEINFLYDQGIIKGISQYFEKLFNYLKKYIRIFYRKFENVPIQDIEDCFQDSIKKIIELKKPLNYKDKSSVDKFFRTIMKNKLFDIIKRKKGSELEDTIGFEPTPLQALISKEGMSMSQKIKDILSHLIKEKPREMTAFCLGFGLGCYKNGKAIVPQNFEFSPIYKMIKTGLSEKIDYTFIKKELAKKGIIVNEKKITSWIFLVRNEIKKYLSSLKYECVDLIENFNEKNFVEFVENSL